MKSIKEKFSLGRNKWLRRISFTFFILEIFLGIADEVSDWLYISQTDYAEEVLGNMLKFFLAA